MENDREEVEKDGKIKRNEVNGMIDVKVRIEEMLIR